jgi:hypothetical protein
MIYSAAAVAIAATGSLVGVAATSASATTTPPPLVPAPVAIPVHHTVVYTSLAGRTQHIGPVVTIYNSLEYAPSTTPPGYTLAGRLVDVCFAIPHLTPPNPTTPVAICNWKLTQLPLSSPVSTLSGRSFLNGLGSVGRVLTGSGANAGAFSLLPNQTTFTNIAPRTQTDTFNFFTP